VDFRKSRYGEKVELEGRGKEDRQKDTGRTQSCREGTGGLSNGDGGGLSEFKFQKTLRFGGFEAN
jgi:hypothetical protein